MNHTGKNEPRRADRASSESGRETVPGQPEDQGLSLDELGAAFAEMLAAGHDPYSEVLSTDARRDADGRDALRGSPVDAVADDDPIAADPAARGADDYALGDRCAGDEGPGDSAAADHGCELSPRTILESMLFVGHPQNEPLTAVQVAGLMRGVRPGEIDELVRDLNEQYLRDGCPYTIASQGAGYRLSLRDEFAGLRDKFQGRLRQARLSPAALEVLALVAYNQPLTSEDVTRLRGRTSGPILAQLVRRQLLRIERPQATPRAARYFTTPRFLKLFGLDGLDDLPRGQETAPN
jgi:segregation and condensation protein B